MATFLPEVFPENTSLCKIKEALYEKAGSPEKPVEYFAYTTLHFRFGIRSLLMVGFTSTHNGFCAKNNAILETIRRTSLPT